MSDGSGVFTWANQSAGSVTSVTAAPTTGNPIVVTSGATPTIDITKADATHNGYLSATDYSSFASKVSNALASANIFVGNSSNVATGVAMSGDATITNAGALRVTGLQGVGIGASAPTSAGQVLRYDGSSTYQPAFLSMADIRSTTLPGTTIFPSTNCPASQSLSWNSLVDAFACQDIAISNTQVSGLGTAALLNVGTSANSVVQLDGNAKLPTVDGSQLTNLNASSLVSGTIDPARLPASTQFWQSGGSGRIGYVGGAVGIGTTAPTAYLQLPASPGTASSAPLKIGAGTLLTTPEVGAIEYDGTNLYYTNSAGRQTLSTSTSTGSQTFAGDVTMSGTGTGLTITNNELVGGSVAVGGSQSVAGTQTVTGLSTLTGGVASAGQVAITNNTASISTTTGALTVTGGVGVGGAINAASVNAPAITSTNLTTTNLNASNNAFISARVPSSLTEQIFTIRTHLAAKHCRRARVPARKVFLAM